MDEPWYDGKCGSLTATSRALCQRRAPQGGPCTMHGHGTAYEDGNQMKQVMWHDQQIGYPTSFADARSHVMDHSHESPEARNARWAVQKAVIRLTQELANDVVADGKCGAINGQTNVLCQRRTRNGAPCHWHQGGDSHFNGLQIKGIMDGSKHLGFPVTFSQARGFYVGLSD
jgi:hypothetical protein